MKRNSILIFLMISFAAHAQIKFEHGSWDEIKAKAKAENKIIFLDAFTSWCGPCKWMAKNTFTNDTVAQYYNTTFINAKIDMEVGEGLDIAKKYEVHIYPSLLYLDYNGDIVHRSIGARASKEFIQLGNDALNPEKQFAAMEKKYTEGNWDVSFLNKYLNFLSHNGLNVEKPLTTYFSKQKDADLSNRQNWTIIESHLNNKDSREFNYLLKNTDEFSKKYTADSVNQKIYSVYIDVLQKTIYGKNADSTKYFSLKDEIKKLNFRDSEKAILLSEIWYYQSKQDYVNYSKSAVPYIDKYENENSMEMNNIAYSFHSFVKDKQMLAKAESWAKKAYDIEKVKPDFDPNITMDTYASLLYTNGKKQEAVKVEQEVLDFMKAKPQEYSKEAMNDIEKKIEGWKK